MSDSYQTLAGRSETRLKIERSDFLGIAFPVTSDEDFFAMLSSIQKTHFDATHHCWAFRLWEEGATRERSSDAGEPSGTAGRPILMAIGSAGLHDVGVVVVRWFGGVKLGAGGLARAYRDTAAATLANARPLERILYARYSVTASFESMTHVYRFVQPPDICLIKETFHEQAEFLFDVRKSRTGEFEKMLTERRIRFEPTPR